MAQPRAMTPRELPKPDHVFSLVVYPTGQHAQAMQESLDTLAAKYSGTKVPVHMTLMAGIVDDVQGARDRAKLLASQLQVQRVFYDKLVSRPVTLYGQPVKSVAISVDSELGFGEWGALAHPTYVRTPMLPRVAHLHISLLYSSTIDDTTLAAIIDDQQERLLGSDGLLHPAEFTVTELTLVETTDSDPSKWQVLGRYKLASGGGPP